MQLKIKGIKTIVPTEQHFLQASMCATTPQAVSSMCLNTSRYKVLTTCMAGEGGSVILTAPGSLYGFCHQGLDPPTLSYTGVSVGPGCFTRDQA